MRVLITGATGTAGSEALNVALQDPEITHVTVLTRRSTGAVNMKLIEVLVKDFTDYSGLAPHLAHQDIFLWDLGISQNAVKKDEYVRITHDYTMAAAAAYFLANPNGRFCFLSGQGADQKEKSLTLFGRVKGRVERELTAKYGDRVYSFRPGYIRPLKTKSFGDRLMKPIAMAVNSVTPKLSVTTRELALCMLGAGKRGAPIHLFENQDIKSFQTVL